MASGAAGRTVAANPELTKGEVMINRKTLVTLAAVTFTLLVAGALIGEDNDVLWIVDDIVWFGFLGCALALIVLTVAALARGARRMGSSRG
jgi:hypothetical protein